MSGPAYWIENLIYLADNIRNGGTIQVSDTHHVKTVSCPNLVTTEGRIFIRDNVALTSFSAPKLEQGLDIWMWNNPAIVTFNLAKLHDTAGFMVQHLNVAAFSLPEFVYSADSFSLSWCPLMTSVSLPKLTMVHSDASTKRTLFAINNCASLQTISMPLWRPTQWDYWLPPWFDFSNCALTEATVNGILSVCAQDTSFRDGLLYLNGGTNAAPTGQGILDAATIAARGNAVTTN